MAKDRRIWDNCKDIGVVMKSNSTRLLVQLTTRDGVKYVNIREQYKRKTDNEWKFGMAGFAVPIEIPINGIKRLVTDELMALINKAAEESKDFALSDPAHAVYASAK